MHARSCVRNLSSRSAGRARTAGAGLRRVKSAGMKEAMALLLAACCTSPALAATTAQAPAATTTSANVAISGWKLECDPGKTELSCHAVDSIVQARTGEALITLNLLPLPGGKTSLTMTVPLGASLRTPIDLSIDGGPSQSFSYLTCSPQGCYATGELNANLLASMRAAKGDLKVSYGLLDGSLGEHGITASLPLTGFAEVDDRLK